MDAEQAISTSVDIDCETAVIGSVLHGGNTVLHQVQGIVQSDMFVLPDHARLYNVLLEADAEGYPVDDPTVYCKALKDAGLVEQVEPKLGPVVLNFLEPFWARVSSAANAIHFARRVKDEWGRRRAIAALSSGQRDLIKVTGSDGREQTLSIVKSLTQLVDDSRESEIQSLGQVLDQHEGQLFGTPAQKINTNIPSIDIASGGLEIPSCNFLAGIHGMGKSSLAWNIALRCGEPVLIFSMEMAAHKVLEAFIAIEAKINRNAVRGQHGRDIKTRIAAAACKVAEADIRIVGGPQTVEEMRGIIIAANAQEPVKLVIIDHLHIIPTVDKSRNAYEAISDVARMLGRLSQTEAVAVLCVCQLSRAYAQREDKRPRISDLRDSGRIAAVADQVWLLHREHFHDRNVEDDEADLEIAKNRYGPEGQIAALSWEPAWGRFESLTRSI